jgi:hypothetical protein
MPVTSDLGLDGSGTISVADFRADVNFGSDRGSGIRDRSDRGWGVRSRSDWGRGVGNLGEGGRGLGDLSDRGRVVRAQRDRDGDDADDNGHAAGDNDLSR